MGLHPQQIKTVTTGSTTDIKIEMINLVSLPLVDDVLPLHYLCPFLPFQLIYFFLVFFYCSRKEPNQLLPPFHCNHTVLKQFCLIYTPVNQSCFTLIHLKGFINRKLSCPASEAGHNTWENLLHFKGHCCLLSSKGQYFSHQQILHVGCKQIDWAPTFSQLVDMWDAWVLKEDRNDDCDSQGAFIHDPTPGRVHTSTTFHVSLGGVGVIGAACCWSYVSL